MQLKKTLFIFPNGEIYETKNGSVTMATNEVNLILFTVNVTQNEL